VSVPNCPSLNLASLGPGQFFGEVELIGGGDSIASVQAADAGALELALIPRDLFQRLLEGSPATGQALSEIAHDRLEENLSRNGDCL